MNEYAKFDTELMTRLFENPKDKSLKIPAKNYVDWGVVFTAPVTQTWKQEKQAQAKLESKRELARQALLRVGYCSATESMGWHQITNASSLEDLEKACDAYGIVYNEEGEMVTKNEQIAELKAQIAQLNKKLELVEYGRWGKEPANGAVFKIDKRFDANRTGYIYAAVKAQGVWYLTGTGFAGSRTYTWKELQEWAGKYSRVWVMTAREELVDES